MSTPEVPNFQPPPRPGDMQFEPMPEKPTPTNVIETLLKHPGRIVHELHHQRDANLSLTLLVVAVLGVALYAGGSGQSQRRTADTHSAGKNCSWDTGRRVY